LRVESGRASDGFALCKWYLDVVASDGHAVICYWSELAWRGIILRAESLLDSPAAGSTSVRSRLTRRPGPREEGGPLSWSSPGLGVHGEWRPLAAPIRRSLYEEERAAIVWACRAPVAEARVSVGGRPPLAGVGYAECLSVSMAAAHLPLDELRWGRFASDSRWAVWIMWSGPNPRTLAWVDGDEVSPALVRDDGLDFSPAERLALDRQRTLRSGRPVIDAIAQVPGLRRAVPRRLRALSETKWLSRGILSSAGKPAAEGWAIHEHVRFREPAS
jgi:hypothetical protein